ncbi:MAG TPA: ribosome silencing factor [Acidiferrobacterales bacterium]|nr:ribosome silencing factor [Acidiferrobacterales bacterium]
MQQLICEILNDAKGQDISVLDVRRLTDITDYMIIASGTSTRHVNAMARKLVDKMRELSYKPLGVEGEDTGEWVLIDFGDVVAHMMHPQTRDFYSLEKLWAEDMAVQSETDMDQEKQEAELKMAKIRRRRK